MKSAVSCLYYGITAALVLLLDQAIKLWVLRYPVGIAIVRLPGLVEITHQFNIGAAFSLFAGKTTLILLLSCMLLPLLLYFALREMRMTFVNKTALTFLAGGSLGNLIDRFVHGGVVDYIRLLFLPFPVFNFADICITLSVCLLAFELLNNKTDQPSGENHHGSNH